ncbi:dihydrofolate reductase [Stieleria varia]|uniref:Dihydrofolate reductase n=1 Tax=Stieleria varia TaxID=2528005 RepID=A0A5C6A432_9BACT|nr:dihydrofolate reductase [Stieleria varia]TWT94664.1 Dihydrofolate reductase type 3 [Stieleria varia]
MSNSLPKLTAVVAVTPDGTIGRDGDMPWRLREDLRRFKHLTMGGVLLMGRRTYESIGKPLPGRRTVVITRNPHWSADGVELAPDPDAAVALAGDQNAFVVGGAQIYEALLPRCEQIFLTTVWSNVVGDTTLKSDWTPFQIVSRTRIPAGLRDDVPTEFVQMVRKNS